MGEQETTIKSWAENWAAAEQAAAAAEKGESDEGQQEGVLGSGSEEDVSGQDETSGDEESPADAEDRGDEQESQPEVAADSAGGDAPAISRADRLKALREEAQALGLEFEGNAVTVADRAKFRAERREMRAKIQAERDRYQAELQQTAEKLEEQVRVAARIQEALERNDLDGIAQAIGRESWNHLSEEALKQQLSPEHRELLKLKRERAEQERRAAEQQRQQKAQQAAQEEARAREAYQKKISKDVAAIKAYKAFAGDPLFVAGIVRHQEEHWDGEETISLEEAAELALKDARLIYDKLHEQFGGQAALQPEKQPAGGAKSTEKPGGKRPPKTVSQSEVADASRTDKSADFDNEAWLKKWTTPIKDSAVSPDS